ncbi:MAG: hypothetical protein AB7I38_07380 [Dehalococcoidia bacterium]
MSQDDAREGRRLAGAITSEEERDGVEVVLIEIVEGQVEVGLTVAPAGDVRLVAMNRGQEAVDLRIATQDGPDSTVVHLREIHPGDSAEAVVDFDAGDYIITASGPQGHPHGTATLIVQPQQGLPASGEDGAAPV